MSKVDRLGTTGGSAPLHMLAMSFFVFEMAVGESTCVSSVAACCSLLQYVAVCFIDSDYQMLSCTPTLEWQPV